ncbi:MAG: hypothetical protein ACOYEV_17025 [Candidatus Nanopelagicales bacterium]|jgi:hypothetical protein
MYTSILAHGGQMTGDEIAIVGSGLFVAFAVPVGALLIAMRRSKRNAEPAAPEDAGQSVLGSEIR